MKIPFRYSLLKIRRTKIRYVVLHQTTCQYPAPESKIDTSKFQIPGLIGNMFEKKQPDINYHFVIDKIKDDYQVIMCRPFVTLCEFPDIDPDINNAAIHIAVMGNYDYKIPDLRLYEVITYRLLNPLMKFLPITYHRIYFHHEISKDELETCPGAFMDKQKLVSMLKRFVVK